MSQQLSEINFESIFFQPIRFRKDDISDSLRTIYQIEAIINELAKTHKKFTLRTIKSILGFLGCDSSLLTTKKTRIAEKVYWDNKFIGAIDFRYFKRKKMFPHVIASALYNKLIPISPPPNK